MHGTTTDADVKANRELLEASHDPGETLEIMFGRILEIQHFATLGEDSITQVAIACSLEDVFEATGVFSAPQNSDDRIIWRSPMSKQAVLLQAQHGT